MYYVTAIKNTNLLLTRISYILIFSMLFYILTPSINLYEAYAKTFSNVGKFTRAVVVNAGALVAGYMGGVLGIALGGGPIGMVAGAVGGFIIGKKFLNWTTDSLANAATVAGAVAGGVLCAGMGFPILAAGVLGGAVIGRVVTQSLQNLFKKTTGKRDHIVRLRIQDKKAQSFIEQLTHENKNTSVSHIENANKQTSSKDNLTSNIDISQSAYERYINAYKAYITALQKGNSTEVQRAYAEYKKYLDEYNASLGKK